MLQWLNNLLGKNTEQQSGTSTSTDGTYQSIFSNLRDRRFGRYSDNNKSYEQTRKWYDAEELYKEKKYEKAHIAFFEYLCDKEEGNVNYGIENGKFVFSLVQGSKIVHGESYADAITARVPLAVMETPGTAVMRRLLELNYNLYYSRTALDENNTLQMVFDTDIPSASPLKLYQGLRELATKGDRQDDMLLADFKTLKTTDTEHIRPLDEIELNAKYRFFRKWIEETLTRVNELNQDSFSGAVAYLLLALIYRIDFLITPEAKLMSQIEKIHLIYWEKKDEVPLVQRNQLMKEAIGKLLDISKEEFAQSVYHSKWTFSMAQPPKYEKVKEHIVSANRDAKWYTENKYPHIAVTISEYGVLYNQFIFSMPKVMTDITTVYMAALHPDFFEAMGLTHKLYDAEKNEFDQGTITKETDLATNRFKDKFKSMKWDASSIKYNNLQDFAISLSELMANLNLETRK